MRRNQKKILKETISFISALSFIASSNLYGISVIADTQTDPEISITDTEEKKAEENRETENSEDEIKERNISFHVVDSDQSLLNIFYNTTSGFRNIFLKNIRTDKSGDMCHININGKDDADHMYIDKDAELESFINYIDINEGKDRIVVFNSKVIYKVDIDDIKEKCEFTAYYACDVPEDRLSVSAPDDKNIIEYNGVRYYKYNTDLILTPQLGWNFKLYGAEPVTIKCTGYIEFTILHEYGEYISIKISEQVPTSIYSWASIPDSFENIVLYKSYFTINLDTDKYVSNCRFRDNIINGSDKYNWASMKDNSGQSILTFEIPEDRNVYQVAVNGELQNVENNVIDLTDSLADNINTNRKIDISIKTNPKTYQTTIKNEKGEDLIKVAYDIENGMMNIPFLKTINNALYRLQSYGYDNELCKVEVDTVIDEIKNNNPYRSIEFCEYNQLVVTYTRILSSDNELLDKYTVGSNYFENINYQNNNIIKIRNEKCYSTSMLQVVIMNIAENKTEQYYDYDIVQEDKNSILYQITKKCQVIQLYIYLKIIKNQLLNSFPSTCFTSKTPNCTLTFPSLLMFITTSMHLI